MPITNKKIYMIDNEPVTPMELIKKAVEIDTGFSENPFRQTSNAANVLRNYGYVVTENPREAQRG